jgi:hypothetical protein
VCERELGLSVRNARPMGERQGTFNHSRERDSHPRTPLSIKPIARMARKLVQGAYIRTRQANTLSNKRSKPPAPPQTPTPRPRPAPAHLAQSFVQCIDVIRLRYKGPGELLERSPPTRGVPFYAFAANGRLMRLVEVYTNIRCLSDGRGAYI